MILTIKVTMPAEEMDMYLEDVVSPQVLEGMVAGHMDPEHYWELSREGADE